MLKHVIGAVLVVSFVLPSSPALAQHASRCTTDDTLRMSPLARGRNAWARKCGYISPAKENYLNSENEYQVFYEACSAFPYYPTTATCQRFAPISENEPCIYGLLLLGSCPAY